MKVIPQQHKNARKKIRLAKLRAEEEKKSIEKATYGAGKFNDVDPLQFSSSSDDDMPLAQLQSKKAKKK